MTRRLTDEDREQLVEFLRCAADHCDESDTKVVGIGAAGLWLDVDRLWAVALEARTAARNDGPTDYRHTCLEAAARVEERSWP